MTDAPLLSAAFIEARPDAAARVLEDVAFEDSAALVEILPARVSAPVISCMMPYTGARCLALMAPDRAAAILRQMAFQDAASLLRVIPPAAIEPIFEALPRNLARDFGKSLRYPSDSLGAWMDQQVSGIPSSRSVAEALRHVRARVHVGGDELFVVDTARKYLGVVRISDLVTYDEKVLLSEIVDSTAPRFSSRSAVTSVIDESKWAGYQRLAVVGRKNNFLGALSRDDIIAATAPRHVKATHPATLSPSILTHMLRAFFVTVDGFVDLILTRPNDGTSPYAPETHHDR